MIPMRDGETRWFDPKSVIRGDGMHWLPTNMHGQDRRDALHPVAITRRGDSLCATMPPGCVPWTRDYAFGGMCPTDADVAEKFAWCVPIEVHIT